MPYIIILAQLATMLVRGKNVLPCVYQNAFKPLTHHAGLMIHPKIGQALIHGRKLDAKRKADKFGGMRGVPMRKKSGKGDVMGHEASAEASTDSFVVTDKTDDVVVGGNERQMMPQTSSSNSDETKGREAKMYDYDDYYEDEKLEDGLTVEDRLKNLFKKDLNEKFFHSK